MENGAKGGNELKNTHSQPWIILKKTCKLTGSLDNGGCEKGNGYPEGHSAQTL
jgi:hypothetical protein